MAAGMEVARSLHAALEGARSSVAGGHHGLDGVVLDDGATVDQHAHAGHVDANHQAKPTSRLLAQRRHEGRQRRGLHHPQTMVEDLHPWIGRQANHPREARSDDGGGGDDAFLAGDGKWAIEEDVTGVCGQQQCRRRTHEALHHRGMLQDGPAKGGVADGPGAVTRPHDAHRRPLALPMGRGLGDNPALDVDDDGDGVGTVVGVDFHPGRRRPQ